MKHLQDFETFNESKLRKFATGAMLLTSLLGSPQSVAKGEDDDIEWVSNKKSKAELAIIDKQQYSALEDNLEKMNYQIYGTKPNFDSHKFLFATSISPKFKYALNEALQQSESKVNELEIDAGFQHIYYLKSKNTYQVIVITEIVSEEEEGREYDRTVGVFRGL